MRYQVPQFLEVEDKIIGPLTFKQFLFLGGGIGLGYICYVYVPSVLKYVLALASVGMGFCFAFVKVNKKPFVFIVQAFFLYLVSPRLYVWHTDLKKKNETGEKEKETEETETNTEAVSNQEIQDLAWSLDINHRGK